MSVVGHHCVLENVRLNVEYLSNTVTCTLMIMVVFNTFRVKGSVWILNYLC